MGRPRSSLRAMSSPPRVSDPALLFAQDGYERRLRQEGWTVIAGVDEAGRGPLAGPVVAAAVILPLEGAPPVADSKSLTGAQRDELYRRLVDCAVVGIGVVEAPLIDELNILRATHRAMAEAVVALSPQPDCALVDGLPVEGLPVPHTAVVKGDRICRSIAAASIIAKVTRDNLLLDLDRRYPQYGFARHKGYATPEHLRRLQEHGPCPAHRRSFRPVRAMLEPALPFQKETPAP